MLEIYTRDNCSACYRLKEFLAEKKIPYTEKVLDKDFNSDMLKQLYPQAHYYPVIVDNKRIFGGGLSELKEKWSAGNTFGASILLNE